MLFRTSYKMSDSLARSTGAVYQRAWRQIVYAVLVIGGAWVGQRWGIVGVAVGILAAVTVNFFLMAHLSLAVVGLRWRAFAATHVPALTLTAALLPAAWGVAALLRSWQWPALGVGAATGAVVAAWAAVLAWRAPTVFLGPDVGWAAATLRGYLSRRAPADAVPGRARGAAERAA
jgi:PST family polysaccharide transporter